MKKAILVTGGTGFLGRNLISHLSDASTPVVSIGRSAPLSASSLVRHIDYDFEFLGDNAAIPWDDIAAVVHLAASGVKHVRRQWDEGIDFNILGTLRLLRLIEAKARTAPPVIIARSFYEHFLPGNADLMRNPYVATKFIGSNVARVWSESYAGTLALATIFQVYGPDDDPNNVLNYAATEIVHNRVALFGSGKSQRDWIYISDAAACLATIVDQCVKAPRQPRLLEYDVASGSLLSIREMVERMEVLARPGAKASLLSFNPDRDRNDVDLIKRGDRLPPAWKPRVHPTEGLRRMLESAKKNIS